MMASHRRGPTASFSTKGDKAVTISGPVKLIAVAVGSITEARPAMNTSVDTHRRVERTSWRTGCEDANKRRPRRGANAISMKRKCPAYRAHVISSTGYVCERYFEEALRRGRRAAASTMNTTARL